SPCRASRPCRARRPRPPRAERRPSPGDLQPHSTHRGPRCRTVGGMTAPTLAPRAAGNRRRTAPAPPAEDTAPAVARVWRAEAAAGARAMAPWLAGMGLYALVVGVSG